MGTAVAVETAAEGQNRMPLTPAGADAALLAADTRRMANVWRHGMGFDPDPNKHDQLLDAPLMEYLGCQPGKNADQFLAVISLRPMPGRSFAFRTFSLSKDQTVRLYEDLHRLLTTPGSWLYVPPAPPEDGGQQ